MRDAWRRFLRHRLAVLVEALAVDGAHPHRPVGVYATPVSSGHDLPPLDQPGATLVVTIEIALAVVLLAGSGLMLRSLDKLIRVNPGFDPSHTLTMRFNTPEEYGRDSLPGFYDEVLDHTAAYATFPNIGRAVTPQKGQIGARPTSASVIVLGRLARVATIIPAGGRYVMDIASGFLNNTGAETVRFLSGSGASEVTYDSYSYSLGSTQSDKVFHRQGDGGAWCATISTNLSKGTPNPATCP